MSTKSAKKRANKKAKHKAKKKDGLEELRADAKRRERNRKARERRAAKKAEALAIEEHAQSEEEETQPKLTTEEQIAEAKRQSTIIPVQFDAEDDGGSHSIDHLTDLDNAEAPDTNLHPSEDLAAKSKADLSFWNNSWCWAESANSYGDRPQDKWFINPTSELIGNVMLQAPLIFSACEVALCAGDHKDQLVAERERHTDFLRAAYEGDIVSESLDMLTAYQARYFEVVQLYLGQERSYQTQLNNPRATVEQIESAELRKKDSGNQCRNWAAKLIALREAYHACVSDPRAFKLTFDFAPLPPEDGKPPTREYSLFKWAVTTALNKIGRRLARNIKDGKMDAEKYRIPIPWKEEAERGKHVEASAMISDFN